METCGFNIWTRDHPKDYLDLYIDYKKKYNLRLLAVVDDVFPEVRFERTKEETAYMNDIYKTYMEEIGFDGVHLVSEHLDRNAELSSIFQQCCSITLKEFYRLLPEKKRFDMESLSLAEIVETSWQLHVLSEFNKELEISRWLAWKRSTALYRFSKDIIPNFNFTTI